MGNGESKPQPSAAAAAAAAGDDNSSATTPASIVRRRRKSSGIPGLLELGFEYRLVPCQPHSVAETKRDITSPHCYSPSQVCFNCETRLFHVESNTMITERTRRQYIPSGTPFFDEVTHTTQQTAQDWLIRDCNMKFVPLFEEYKGGDGGGDPVSVRALVSQDYDNYYDYDGDNNGDDRPRNPTLLIMTGKGKSRAGILSFMHLLTSGFEKGSALFHIIEAIRRGYSILCIDPNALGVSNGYQTTCHSLNRLLLDSEDGRRKPLYVLAHSASGGYLVQYLAQQSPPTIIVDLIVGIVFSDSTHRIRNDYDERLRELLESQSPTKCLYVRNTSEHPSNTFANHKNKKAGEIMTAADVGNQNLKYWKQRFGTIKTVWAGTQDHSYVCYASRNVIWEFYDTLS